MKMRSSTIVRSLFLAAVLCSAAGPVVAQIADESSTQAGHAAAKRRGFFAYLLGKINPQDKDYGATLEISRHSLEEHTIDDLYFWSNVITLVLLSGLAAVAFLQWRAMDKRELIAASLIAQLWNGRVSDRIEITRRTAQFNQLAEAHNAEVEAMLSRKPGPSEAVVDTAGSLKESVRNLAEGKGISPMEAERIAASASDGTAASLEQSNLLLKRRVEALQNSEQNLKQRLNQTTVLLDQERRRNATLKGA
ncbi:hypothetical protein DYQ86_05215 [Acidobacteria bacterium AB60]|nr:hypothetical protein DYQ86_05215 [Acidobacteria bacterium AB60]